MINPLLADLGTRTYHLLTVSEVITRKSQIEALCYRSVNTLRPRSVMNERTMLLSYLLYGLFRSILQMNTTKNTRSNVTIRSHSRSCSLNGNEPGDAIETTRHSFYDNERFWTSACDQLKSITGQRITLRKHVKLMNCTLEPRYSRVTLVSGYSFW